jgi:oligopeptide transport system substrate-binding protein
VRGGFGVILLAALLTVCFFGCADGDVIRMDIEGPVENLDPQFATDPDSRMILGNLMEGLLVKGPDGELLPGAAKSWEVSADGLTYTFTLREDAAWEENEPLTARHFVFAFERIFNPKALSPFAEDYAVIEGGEEILAGEATLKRLGVSSPDGHTVIFKLRRPSAVFAELLAETPALPCNEEIYNEAKGRYGLAIEYVYSNGPFILSRWDNTRYLYLTPNPGYGGEYRALPGRVTLYIGREDPVGQFFAGNSDLVYLSGADISRAEEDAELIPLERTVWCVVFNGGRDAFRNALLRQALSLTADREALSQVLPANLTVTGVFAPPGMRAGALDYRDKAGYGYPLEYDPGRGKELYDRALDILELGRMPHTVFHIPESGRHGDYMKIITEGWRRTLGAEVVFEQRTGAELEEILRTGEYRMMLFPFTPAAGSPGVLLGAFGSNSGQNYFGYQNSRFDESLASAAAEETEEGAAERFREAEEQLLFDAGIIPLYFETGGEALAKGLTGVEVPQFGGQIRFWSAQKE